MPLPRARVADAVPYAALYDGDVAPRPIDEHTVGEFLRCSLGLSAWKQYQASRWALRVNPSSGNLHPTEAYIVWHGRVFHYAPREHALEARCERLDAARPLPLSADGFLVVLTSIFWREAWKYGERAFRYCQHDIGHAIGALRFAAALLGWRAVLLPHWSDDQIASLVGVDRDEDFVGAEREAPECILAVTRAEPDAWFGADPSMYVAAGRARWKGAANTLSRGHVDWPIIEEIASATRYRGASTSLHPRTLAPLHPAPLHPAPLHPALHPVARAVILQRRSAVAFHPAGRLAADAFFGMMRRVVPGGPPWDVIHWPPCVHLALFVHRVDGVTPGVYMLVREPGASAALRASMRPEFLWEPVQQVDGLFLLLPYDMTWAAQRISCDQDIAGDGYFSLGMITRFEASLSEHGPSFYRRLFWECGLIGQVLYLEAEAAGGRSTGIGCFYDEPVHDVLGLSGHAWQSLYHFSMGVPVDDDRLTTETGYPEDF